MKERAPEDSTKSRRNWRTLIPTWVGKNILAMTDAQNTVSGIVKQEASIAGLFKRVWRNIFQGCPYCHLFIHLCAYYVFSFSLGNFGLNRKKLTAGSNHSQKANDYLYYTLSWCGNTEDLLEGFCIWGGRWDGIIPEVSGLQLFYDSM